MPALTSYSQVYMGCEWTWVTLLPKIYWTNPIWQWASDMISVSDASMEGYYASTGGETRESEGYLNNYFTGQPTETVLVDHTISHMGGGAWIGVGKFTTAHFYIGIEEKFIYKHLKIDEQTKDNILLDCTRPRFFLKTLLTGESKYDLTFKCSREIEAETAIRLGFKPKDNLLVYIKSGVSLQTCAIDMLRIFLHGTISMKRNDDTAVNPEAQMLYPFPDQKTYEIPGERHYFASLNLGAGLEKMIGKKAFVRLEYNFKMAFSKTLRSMFDDKNIDKLESVFDTRYARLFTEYALRYQDKEHQISMGIGRHF